MEKDEGDVSTSVFNLLYFFVLNFWYLSLSNINGYAELDSNCIITDIDYISPTQTNHLTFSIFWIWNFELLEFSFGICKYEGGKYFNYEEHKKHLRATTTSLHSIKSPFSNNKKEEEKRSKSYIK